MEFYIEKETLRKHKDSDNLLDKIRENVLKNASKEFVACFLAGCTFDIATDNNKMILKTRFPVYVLKHPNGEVLNVIEKKV